jgi:hypothetical protein
VTVTAFDPADGAFVADPYPAYAALRAAGRVLDDQRSDHWLVPHHADVSALLRGLPRLAPAEEPAWKPTYVLRGLQALRVTT